MSEKGGDDAAPSKQKDPGVGPDEGRRHGCHDDQDIEKRFPLDPVQREEIGEGHSDGDRQHGGGDGYLKAVDQCIKVIAFCKELGEVFHGKPARCTAYDRLLDQIGHGVDQKQDINCNHAQRDHAPDVETKFIIILHMPHPSQD